MFYHVKELQFDARVSKPDPRFARLLLEQFGGGNGELKAAMQYFVQSFSARQPYPDKYDLLMDIATEEFSHLEIVGATITMLLDGINGELKNAADQLEIMQLLDGQEARENLIHAAMVDPQALVTTGGGPALTNSAGVPWSGAYVTANGDLSVDLRSNIAAESRAKVTYEYLLQFTDDPLIHESLRFLMTREISHMQMFTAALDSIQPNFPPAILQGDPRYTHLYFNLSNGSGTRGPWNQGQGPWPKGEEWVFIQDPIQHVIDTQGLTEQQDGSGKEGGPGNQRSMDEIKQKDQELSRQRSEEIKQALPKGENQWTAPADQAPSKAPKRGK